MNTMKKKTITGHAASINLNGAVKCGGVAVNGVKNNLAANSVNMSQKKTKTRARTRLKKNKRR